MNKEEAIKYFRNAKGLSSTFDKAADMAIEALENVNSIKPPGDSISRSDAKDKAKEIMYSILDDTDYNGIESMAHACLVMKIKILKMFEPITFPMTSWF